MKNKEIEQQHIKSQNSLKKYAKDNGFEVPDILEYKIVAIGYLSIDEEFKKGEVSTNFLTKLKVLWGEGIMGGSLGSHECEFCIDEGNYENRGTSSEEKELIDKENNIKYFFPKMIFHYITEHNFKPSNKFIEFVMRK
ncbi:hypothetical protein LCGC14_0687760 [marine sediment metagenome]|uniref:DUF7919 domain-containing protein n=1 Tax=marine sediment metagenome TaxID=412755 RepID=A0A0F9QLB3_9ZZZZ